MLTPEQLAMRRTGMGGSETAALFGLHKFKRPFDVYVSKVEGWEAEQNEDMLRGECREDGHAVWYGKKHKAEIINPDKTFRHKTRPLILATPDRFINTPTGELELLSIKDPRNPDDFGEDETQQFPAFANIQIQQEAAVLKSHGYNIARAWIAAPVWGELRRYPVRLDDELQDRIMSGAERWWSKYVEAKVPPPIDGGEGARRWLLSRFPHAEGKEKVEASLAQEAAMVALREAELKKVAAEEVYETAKSRAIEALGAAYGLIGSFGTCTYGNNQWGKRTFRPRWKKGG